MLLGPPRSAIIEKNHFCTRESPEIIVRGKLEPLAAVAGVRRAGGNERNGRGLRSRSGDNVGFHRSIWSIDNKEFSKNAKFIKISCHLNQFLKSNVCHGGQCQLWHTFLCHGKFGPLYF